MNEPNKTTSLLSRPILDLVLELSGEIESLRATKRHHELCRLAVDCPKDDVLLTHLEDLWRERDQMQTELAAANKLIAWLDIEFSSEGKFSIMTFNDKLAEYRASCAAEPHY